MMIKQLCTLLCLLLLSATAKAQNDVYVDDDTRVAKEVKRLSKQLPKTYEHHVRLDSVTHLGGSDIGCYYTVTKKLSEAEKTALQQEAEDGHVPHIRDNNTLDRLLIAGTSIYYHIYDKQQELITTQVYTKKDLRYTVDDLGFDENDAADKQQFVKDVITKISSILPIARNGLSFDSVAYLGNLEIACHITVDMPLTEEQKQSIKKLMAEEGIERLKQDKRLSILMDLGCTIYYYMYDNKQQRFVEQAFTPEDYK